MASHDGCSARKLCAAQWAIAATLIFTSAIALMAAVAIDRPLAHAQVATPGVAQAGYNGVWYDDTGQGAIEIFSCPDGMCGRVVWLKVPLDKSGKPLVDGNNSDPKQRMRPICGLPILGGLKRQRDGSWDEGWIYDPKQGKQFDLELKLKASDALQVTGYMGVKFLSETFIWKRAPADIKRCA